MIKLLCKMFIMCNVKLVIFVCIKENSARIFTLRMICKIVRNNISGVDLYV